MKSQHLILGVLVVLVVGGGFFYIKNQSASRLPQRSEVSVTNVGTKDSKATNVLSRYVDYSSDNLAKATANEGRAVIFFHASWCPLCSEAEVDLKSNWDKVPQDVTILKTDYDSSKELKTKYGIVSQDTWVQVDVQGTEITKWNSGGKGLQTLLANLK